MAFLKNKKLWIIVGTLITALGTSWAAGMSPEQIFDAVITAILGVK